MSADQYLLTEIVIRRLLIDDEDRTELEVRDGNGETPALVEILGLLRMAEDTAIRHAMGETPPDMDDPDE